MFYPNIWIFLNEIGSGLRPIYFRLRSPTGYLRLFRVLSENGILKTELKRKLNMSH